ncbi:MAG: hypothetical protein ACI3YH_09330 [Eubacteriales bacterium]
MRFAYFLKPTGRTIYIIFYTRIVRFAKAFPAFSLAGEGAKKKLGKKKRHGRVSRSAESEQGSAPWMATPFEKGGRKLFGGNNHPA